MEGQRAEEVSKAGPAQSSRALYWVKLLIVLVACLGAVAWAWRSVREGTRPSLGLARQLRDGDVDDRQIAARLLGESGPKDLDVAVPSIVAALDDPNELVRASAASALGTAGLAAIHDEAGRPKAKVAAAALAGALGDDNVEVRIAATDSLAGLAGASKAPDFPFDPDAVGSTIVGLLADPSRMTRKRAEMGLSKIAVATSIKPPASLLEGLGRWEAGGARASAALALGSFKEGKEATVLALTGALKDKDPEVRNNAAVSLQKFAADASAALPSLVENVGDPHAPPPTEAPKSAIAPSSSPRGGFDPAAFQPTIDPAVEALNAIGPIVGGQVAKGGTPSDEVIEALRKAYRSGRPAIKRATEQALGRIGKGASAAVPDLIKALTESTSDVEPDGPSAATLLGAIAPGTPSASPAIAALAAALDSKNSDTRFNAAVALGKFGPAASGVVPRLREFGADPNKEFASAANLAADRVEGKAPPEAPRRKNRGGGARR